MSYRKIFLPRYATALQARFTVANTPDRPLFERLTHLWGNHFTVSAAKSESMATVASFDRDVARRHAVSRFSEILVASTTLPAMLVYLDPANRPAPRIQAGAPFRRRRAAACGRRPAR